MLRNELKEILPDGWEKEFKHREDWDPEGYSVAVFKLSKDKREIVLARFDETDDIMDYFFDDKPYNYEFDLDKALKNFLNKDNNSLYKFSKEYIIYGGNFGKMGMDLNDRINTDLAEDYYPNIRLHGSSISIHRLIAFLFVPNPYPDKYNQVNHIDTNKTNFKKENLEWCSAEWNSNRENQKEYKAIVLYLRESDNKIFSSTELSIEYGLKYNNITSSIRNAVKTSQEYKGSTWKIINPTLNEYLLKHPLRDDWYSHPTIKNLFANACGVVKFDNRLRIGSLNFKGTRNQPAYYISINNKKYLLHRLLAECYFGRVLLDFETVDHINPVINGIDNSIENLKICSSMKENMSNKKTRLSLSTKTVLSDLFGKNIKEYSSRIDLFNDLSIERRRVSLDKVLVIDNNYLIGDNESSIKNKLNYIYYKWEIDSSGNKNCIKACRDLGPLSDNYSRKNGNLFTRLRKYLNTGMPAPDGYYYQQGTPGEMIYDPTNTKLEKKRPEIYWKDRDKN